MKKKTAWIISLIAIPLFSAVCTLHAQTEDKAPAALELRRQGLVPQQPGHRPAALLHRQDRVLPDGNSRQQPVAGGCDGLPIVVKCTRARFEGAAEEIVEALYAGEVILRRVDVRAPDEHGDQGPGGPRVQKAAARPGDPRAHQGPQQGPARGRAVEKGQWFHHL